jgi:hypothetical protein
MSYSDVRSMPLPYRRWFIERLAKEFKREADVRKKANDERRGLKDIPMGEMSEMMREIDNSPQERKFNKG